MWDSYAITGFVVIFDQIVCRCTCFNQGLGYNTIFIKNYERENEMKYNDDNI